MKTKTQKGKKEQYIFNGTEEPVQFETIIDGVAPRAKYITKYKSRVKNFKQISRKLINI